MRHSLFLALCLSAALLTAGCGSDDDTTSPTSPTPAITLTGNWTGTIVVQASAAKMTWVLTEVTGSPTVTGTVLIAEPSGTVLLNGGVEGTWDGTTFAYTIGVGAGGVPSQPSCVGQLTGTGTMPSGSASTINGNVAVIATSCASPLDATSFTLTRS